MSENKNIPTPYEDLLKEILEHGTQKSDRTGTGTISLFGRQIRYDLSEFFPLLTTKKVYLRGITGELLWFLKGDTRVSTLRDQNIRIWNEWTNPDDTIGPGYSHSWRNIYAPSNDVVEIEKRSDDTDWGHLFAEEGEDIHDLYSVHKDRGSVIVLKNKKTNFAEYVSRQLWDEMQKRNRGLADDHESVEPRSFALWEDILDRCYDNRHPQNQSHTGDGMTVSPQWHSYTEFKKTLPLVIGYHQWYNGEELDIDATYFASDVYSPYTSIFVSETVKEKITKSGSAVSYGNKLYPTQENVLSHHVTTTSPHWDKGDPEFHDNLYETITATTKKVHPREGYVYRPRVFHDQIVDALEMLKNDPDSRRNVTIAWHVPELEHMALPPCHLMFQFYVVDGKLSCQMYQRSADMFLGVPFNIASYAILTHMFAQQAGLDVGEFVWTGGDCHIYNNLVDQVKEQLSREPRPYPTLELKKRESLFDYEISDVVVHGYDPHPAIKGQVSV